MTRNTSSFPTAMLEYTPRGLYCPQADIYVDPQRKVEKAIVTHAHADHARPGHKNYICHTITAPVIRHRLGKKISLSSFAYAESFTINGVKFSLHPAGHVPGSAQVRIEYKGEVWVITGDFKTEDDGLSTPFEPLRCHGLIMESSFALPVYQWKPQHLIVEEIHSWWQSNREADYASALMVYSFGKAQRLVHLLDQFGIPLLVHPGVKETNDAVRSAGISLPDVGIFDMSTDSEKSRNHILLLPGISPQNRWNRAFGPISAAAVSGWMQFRQGRQKRQDMDGFAMSDHADWAGLNWAVKSSEAEKVIVMHGFEEIFARYLREKGMEAYSLSSYSTEKNLGDEPAEGEDSQ